MIADRKGQRRPPTQNKINKNCFLTLQQSQYRVDCPNLVCALQTPIRRTANKKACRLKIFGFFLSLIILN